MRADSQHLSSAQVADLLDERLAPSDRDAVVAHLAACAECRHEVAELHGALASVDQRRPRVRWLVAATVAAAAVVAFATIPNFAARRAASGASPNALRTAVEPSPIDAPARITIVEPADSGFLSRGTVFRWKSAGADASYLVTVQDPAGAVLWTTTVTDTSASLPVDVKLTLGTRYFWSVDARLGDGNTAVSGAHSFTAR